MTDPTPDRPLVTFALFAYNQEEYIREAVEGAFAQTYEPLEIILSDDCSSDRTFKIMREMAAAYQGPHDVRTRRNEKNEGLACHVNAVMQEAQGEIWLLAAGDDVSLPERTQISFDCLQRNPSASAVLLSADVIDETGQVVGERINRLSSHEELVQTLSHLLNWKHVTFGATRAIRRNTWDCFGPLNPTCPTEDTPFLLRSLICGENVLSRHKAVRYRRHGSNLSSLASLRSMNKKEIYRQYRDDMSRAKNLGLISTSDAEKLNYWILADQEIRDLRIKLASKQPLKFSEVLAAVWHPATGVREKLKFLLGSLSTQRGKFE